MPSPPAPPDPAEPQCPADDQMNVQTRILSEPEPRDPEVPDTDGLLPLGNNQPNMPKTLPAAPEARDSEEALHLDDASMVFRSRRAPTPKPKDKKAASRAAREKLKARRCTPAPTFKRNGRKRLDDSPLPEDKQKCKRIDFWDDTIFPFDSPKCRAELFPAIARKEEEELQPARAEQADTENEQGSLAIVCYAAPGLTDELPAAGSGAGEGLAMVRSDEGGPFHTSRSKLDGESKSNCSLVGERFYCPEMVGKTKHLLESSLVTCQFEDSQDSLAVGSHMQPRENNLLILASLDSADMLDVAAAQPLLAGGTPKKVQPTSLIVAEHTSDAVSADLPIGTIHHEQNDSEVEMEVQVVQVPERPGGVLGWDGPASAPLGSGAEYVVPLDEFPPLDKNRYMKNRNRFDAKSLTGADGSRDSGGGSRVAGFGSGKQSPSGEFVHAVGTEAGHSRGSLGVEESRTAGFGGQAENQPRHAGTSAETAVGVSTTGPRSMADLFRNRPNPNGPQVFAPEKITNMGFASTSNGLPSIYFSGAEIQKLADSIGYAIVGKFSHSIPNSMQIGKSLENIKFQRGFSWKYINAKHILVQFEDMADYARLLSGPKGTPVWYVDRHPMRVFKWTPDFDAYCESPIAAIWCNLIGLPIHLFDQSALFAIGKLLGTPIQVDRATADRSRLSFARICIEIDITKPPPEEIILDICGREIVQKVRWGKIPAFCQECKHVGHSSEVCYAAGRTERPERRNYHTATPKENQQDGYVAKENQEQSPQPQKETNKGRQWKSKGQGNGKGDGSPGAGGSITVGHMELDNTSSGWVGPDIMGGPRATDRGKNPEYIGRGGGVDPEGVGDGLEPDRGFDLREVGLANHVRSRSYGGGGAVSGGRGWARGSGRFSADGGRGVAGGRGLAGGRGPVTSASFLNTNQYYALMDNGEYDVEGYGEDEPTGVGV